MRAADRPFLGVMLMLGFCACAPLADSIAKILGSRYPLVQLLAIRFALQAVLLAPVILVAGTVMRLDRRVFWLTALRTALHVAGVAVMFLSLRVLPLADTIAISFVMPFLMLLLGWFFLGETVGWHRLAACAVGFAGTLLVIQPNFASVGPAAFLPVLAAVIFAVFMLVTRQIARDADPLALQATSGVMASAVLVPVLLLGGGWPEVGWAPPSGPDWGLMLALGVVGTGAHLLMTWSLRFAPTSTLAPMQYLEIPFATVIGFAVFRELPNGLAALGIAITIAAGLSVVRRERTRAVEAA